MRNEKWVQVLKNKGTLGVLTLCLVGAAAFGSYRSSPEEKMQPPKEEAKNETKTEINEKKLEASGSQVLAELENARWKENTISDPRVQRKKQIKQCKEQEAQTEETENIPANAAGNVQANIQPTVQFSEDSLLTWPAAGTVLMDYNMNHTVYFKTLNQYKCNPALIISSKVGNQVIASAKGIVDSVVVNEETGTTLKLKIGDHYNLVYGQLKDVAVSEGEVVEQGQLLGYVNEPTKYYVKEGSNLYFQVEKDGRPVDPFLYLE